MEVYRPFYQALADWRESTPEVKELWAARQRLADLSPDASPEERRRAIQAVFHAHTRASAKYLGFLRFHDSRLPEGESGDVLDQLDSLKQQIDFLKELVAKRMRIIAEAPSANEVLGALPDASFAEARQ